jgi:hypothetical protein
MSADKHQGLKKGPSARREQRKASSGEMSTANGFFLALRSTHQTRCQQQRPIQRRTIEAADGNGPIFRGGLDWADLQGRPTSRSKFGLDPAADRSPGSSRSGLGAASSRTGPGGRNGGGRSISRRRGQSRNGGGRSISRGRGQGKSGGGRSICRGRGQGNNTADGEDRNKAKDANRIGTEEADADGQRRRGRPKTAAAELDRRKRKF